jgi:hypothetical protein
VWLALAGPAGAHVLVADLVVSAIGVEPATEWLPGESVSHLIREQCGRRVDMRATHWCVGMVTCFPASQASRRSGRTPC